MGDVYDAGPRPLDERQLTVSELSTVEDVIVWLQKAKEICAEAAENAQTRDEVCHLTGRSHAFEMAAQLLEDVTRREQG